MESIGHTRRRHVPLIALTAATLTARGVEGDIADYDTISVYEDPDAPNSVVVAELNTMNAVTVPCHTDGYYKISFDGRSGYVRDDTGIISDDGDLPRPDSVSEC